MSRFVWDSTDIAITKSASGHKKGGEGSGYTSEAGHRGIPKKRGGSLPADANAGLEEKINPFMRMADLPSENIMTNSYKLEDARRERVKLQARIHGFDVRKVSYGGKGDTFDLNGEKLEVAGNYNPITGEITIFSSAFDGKDERSLREIFAHEAMHAMAAKFKAAIMQESAAIMTIFNGNSKFLLPNGDLRDPDMRANYKAWQAYRDFFGTSEKIDAMRKADYSTVYSGKWWNAEKNGDAQVWDAINETLAEIASLGSLGEMGSVKGDWVAFYRRVKDYFNE